MTDEHRTSETSSRRRGKTDDDERDAAAASSDDDTQDGKYKARRERDKAKPGNKQEGDGQKGDRKRNVKSGQRGADDIWSMIVEDKEIERKASESTGSQRADESNLIFFGSKGSGKTTIVYRLLERDDKPKPTIALEYTYGRKSRGHNLAKDIVHIWELGGGTELAKLLEIPVNTVTIRQMAFVMVVDLSKLGLLFNTLDVLFAKARKRIDSIMAAMANKGSKLPSRMKERAWKQYGADHPDRKHITPMVVPFVIIGTMYDDFKDCEPEKKKIVCRTLRTIAHINGAALHFVSNKDEGSMNRCRNILNNAAFKSAPLKTVQLDHNKPITCPAGSDILSDIGKPDHGGGGSPVEAWRKAFEHLIPQCRGNEKDDEEPEDLSVDSKYAEDIIDSIRSQKNANLDEKYSSSKDKSRSGRK